MQWLRDNLGLIRDAKEIETLAATVEDNGGAYFVPAFSGLFAPHWRPDARGALVGLTRYVNKGHIARAALEATAFQTREVLEAMNADSGVPLTELRVDGGMVVNETLMQFQADLLGVDVVRPVVAETTALGAAYAAGLAVGYWAQHRRDPGELGRGPSLVAAARRGRARATLPHVEEGRPAHPRLGRRRHPLTGQVSPSRCTTTLRSRLLRATSSLGVRAAKASLSRTRPAAIPLRQRARPDGVGRTMMRRRSIGSMSRVTWPRCTRRSSRRGHRGAGDAARVRQLGRRRLLGVRLDHQPVEGVVVLDLVVRAGVAGVVIGFEASGDRLHARQGPLDLRVHVREQTLPARHVPVDRVLPRSRHASSLAEAHTSCATSLTIR